MTYAPTNPEREQLEKLEELITTWRRTLDDGLASSTAADAIDDEYLQRFLDTARALSVRLHRELPLDLDPAAVAEIRGHLVEALSAPYEQRGAGALDVLDRFVVHAEAIRHIVRDALDGQPACDEADSRALIESLTTWLPRINRADLGSLIGLSERQVQRLIKDSGVASRRLQLLTRLVALLRLSWTPEGVVAWFYRRRTDLSGRAPIDVIDDPEYERRLMLAVRDGRAQHGS